jgi:streptomycin 6-kinase
MKLNITPGEWYIKWQANIFGQDDRAICSTHANQNNSDNGVTHNQNIDNATAIVTAVNNTYHKGINPEAVPDMLDALKMALQTLIVNYPLYKECPEYEFISKAIQKATL